MERHALCCLPEHCTALLVPSLLGVCRQPHDYRSSLSLSFYTFLLLLCFSFSFYLLYRSIALSWVGRSYFFFLPFLVAEAENGSEKTVGYTDGHERGKEEGRRKKRAGMNTKWQCLHERPTRSPPFHSHAQITHRNRKYKNTLGIIRKRRSNNARLQLNTRQ